MSELLTTCAAVLADAGFDVHHDEDHVLAETAYALVLVVATQDADDALVHAAQLRLLELASADLAVPRGDLYLVLATPPERYDAVRDAFTADTRRARKLVVTGDRDRVEQLLRPLLPLRPLADTAVDDPLVAMGRHLVRLGVRPDLADAALRSFREHVEVRIP